MQTLDIQIGTNHMNKSRARVEFLEFYVWLIDG